MSLGHVNINTDAEFDRINIDIGVHYPNAITVVEPNPYLKSIKFKASLIPLLLIN